MAAMDPTLCFDNELRTHFQFKSASDALLARLSIMNGIEDAILDLFLSVVNDPNFDSKEVSFKESADIHLCVAERRQENLDSLGNRSSQDMVNVTAGLPTVVLDCVVDVLKYELEDAVVALRSGDGISFISPGPPLSCFGNIEEERKAIRASRRVLSTCCVVHTSWLSRAHRALGCALMLPLRRTEEIPLLSHFVRSPLYSSWTRQVDLKFSLTDHRQRLKNLPSMFSRMPNIDFLQLDFTGKTNPFSVIDQEERDFDTEFIQFIFDTICGLQELQQLNLVMKEKSFPDLFFNIALPKLKSICFVGPNAGSFLVADPMAEPSLQQLVTANPKLQLIAISSSKYVSVTNHVETRYISWAKTSKTPVFSLDAIGLDLTKVRRVNPEPSALRLRLLSGVGDLRVCCSHNSEMPALVCAATSAPSIALCVHGNSPDVVLQALRSLRESVKCVVVILGPMYNKESLEKLSNWDQFLADALASRIEGRTCGLQRIEMAFLPSPSFKGIRDLGSMGLSTLLPKSKSWCKERDVLLELTFHYPNDVL
ncbi:hypothetical protein SCHPADRAFT_900204 [Schizopora paradoxa]|uniref:Uncharacterized protein n=1 Tax=Schizopora paradoxa TaxID=27342 RepID=A0A0H2S1T3_9AGAM|nr:hypothetical protein SCHPADRAFT_900204 [Schizopora paradoxa]